LDGVAGIVTYDAGLGRAASRIRFKVWSPWLRKPELRSSGSARRAESWDEGHVHRVRQLLDVLRDGIDVRAYAMANIDVKRARVQATRPHRSAQGAVEVDSRQNAAGAAETPVVRCGQALFRRPCQDESDAFFDHRSERALLLSSPLLGSFQQVVTEADRGRPVLQAAMRWLAAKYSLVKILRRAIVVSVRGIMAPPARETYLEC
jgi:hypothetical protein